MIESELKILLDPAALTALRAHPRLPELALGPASTETLVSVYHDTEGERLAAAGVALRLRRKGRLWVQTIKRRGTAAAGTGFFDNREDERPAPGGRLVLDGDDPDGALAAVRAAAAGEALAPIFETRVARTSQRLGVATGEVELAIDEGEIRAGAASVPIREAELELVKGEVGAIFAVARALFDRGPLRLGTSNKAARGYRLRHGDPEPVAEPRKAGDVALDPATTVEVAARDILRDCLGQIAANVVAVCDGTAVEGPHQLRVGLRRLRTAFAVFAPSLGGDAMAPLAEAARALGREVGRLRDADVLLEEVVARTAGLGLDAPARAALETVLAARRERIRAEVRAVLAAPATSGFLLDLAAFVETRGWLAPADYGQTERLATPIGVLAPGLLGHRQRKAKKRARHIRDLDAAGLHALRKALKKLRYTVDMLGGLLPGKRADAYRAALKELQDSFGALNDAAMARHELAGPETPAPGDPAAQRAVGWTLGALAVEALDARPRVIERWGELAGTRPFWK